MKIGRLPLIAGSLGCAACTGTKTPEPDPAKLDALIASMESDTEVPGKTERLIASVEKVSPERIDPNLVAAVAD